MACSNLLPHQEPDLQLGLPSYDSNCVRSFVEPAVLDEAENCVEAALSTTSGPTIDYDGAPRQVNFNEHIVQPSFASHTATILPKCHELNRKRRSLLHRQMLRSLIAFESQQK